MLQSVSYEMRSTTVFYLFQELFGTSREQPNHSRSRLDESVPSSIFDVISQHRSGGGVGGPARSGGHATSSVAATNLEDPPESWAGRDISPAGLSPKGSPDRPVAGKSPESLSIASLDLEPAGEEHVRKVFTTSLTLDRFVSVSCFITFLSHPKWRVYSDGEKGYGHHMGEKSGRVYINMKDKGIFVI
jgi:hypothetical protein